MSLRALLAAALVVGCFALMFSGLFGFMGDK